MLMGTSDNVDDAELCCRFVSITHNGVSRRDDRDDIFTEAEHEDNEEKDKALLCRVRYDGTEGRI